MTPSYPRKFVIALVGFLFSVCVSLAAPIKFEIPAQPLPAALKVFVKQSNMQVVFNYDELQGVNGNEVRGEFEPDTALDALVKGTGVVVTKGMGGIFVVKKTDSLAATGSVEGSLYAPPRSGKSIAGVAVTVLETGASTIADRHGKYSFPELVPGTYTLIATGEGFSRLRIEEVIVSPNHTVTVGAQEMPIVKKEGEVQMMGEVVVMAKLEGIETLGKVEVTGSRILRNPNETDSLPVEVYNREDMERMGAVTMGDVMAFLTQSSQGRSLAGTGLATTGILPGLGAGTGALPGMSSSDTTGADTRTTVDLRGLGNNTTLVLVDGQRLSISGQGIPGNTSSAGGDDYDLGIIPLSAVERIEVLPDGASAIYGADAIGGVVNIITRRDYNSTELTLTYGNTSRGDSTEKDVALTYGESGPKQHMLISVDYYQNSGLKATDRPFSATNDWSSSGGGNGNVPAAQFSGTGSLGTVRLPTIQALFGGKLPGLNYSYASLPAGQGGTGLSPASFNATQGVLTTFNPAPYVNLISPEQHLTLFISSDFSLAANLSLVFDPSLSQSKTYYYGVPPSITQGVQVPASNPYNPFGVPVTVSRIFYQMGPSRSTFTNTDSRTPLGFHGEIGDAFHYEIDALRDEYEQKTDVIDSPNTNTTALSAAVAQTTPGQALNLFGDDRNQAINSPAVLAAIFPGYKLFQTGITQSAEAKISGTILELPAGPLDFAAGTEAREEIAEFEDNSANVGLTPTLATPSTGSDRPTRQVRAAYAEISVPIFGSPNRTSDIGKLTVQLAGRLDDYSDFGTTINPQLSALWKINSQISVRSSFSTGFKPGSVADLYGPLSSGTYFFSTGAIDPANGQPLPADVPITVGGNPNLKPEKSRSWSYGLVLAPKGLPGLSINIDSFYTRYYNKIESLSPLDLVDYFPERVTRGPSVNGVPGPVVSIDDRDINFASVVTDGADFDLLYTTTTGVGTFDFRGRATYVNSYNVKESPSAPEVNEVNSGLLLNQPQRWRANVAAFWSRKGWGAGITERYVNSFTNDYLIQNFPTATNPLRVRADYETDIQLSMDLSKMGVGKGGRSSDRLLPTKIIFEVVNVFDRAPPPINGNGGYAISDPRMARYDLTAKYEF